MFRMQEKRFSSKKLPKTNTEIEFVSCTNSDYENETAMICCKDKKSAENFNFHHEGQIELCIEQKKLFSLPYVQSRTS